MSATQRKEKIEEIIKQKPNLQCLPFVAIKAIGLVNDPKATTRDLCKLIRTDTSLTARVLREVNSVEYALNRKIADVEQAVLYLGFDKIKNVTLVASTKRLKGNKLVSNMFKKNLLLANVAKHLCKNLDNFSVSEDAFIAGLLQGSGRILLLEKFPQDYFPLLKYRGSDLEAQEILNFGMPYTHVSSGLLKSWDLPEQIADSVKCSGGDLQKECTELGTVLNLANKLSEFSIKTGIPNEFFKSFDRSHLETIKLSPIQVKQAFTDAYNRYAQVLEAMFGSTLD